MIFLQIVGMAILSAIVSVILTPFLQYAFKLTEGQKNSFSDSFKICFYANFITFVIAYVLPLIITSSSIDWIWDGLSSIIGMVAFTYLIAKELSDLKRSFLIALLLQGLTFLFALALGILIIAIGFGTVIVSG
tara:strand:+ start:33 stop:431 length:399 start_codon:yes stop_codon:yes gene_type:complete